MVIAIAVSIVVWVVGVFLFHWVPFSIFALVVSLIVAVAGGLIAYVILVRPPGLQTLLTNTGVQFFIVAIVAALSLYTIATLGVLAAQHNANVTCFPKSFNSNEANANINTVRVGEWMKWNISGPATTSVQFEFVPKGNGLGTSPFENPLQTFSLVIPGTGLTSYTSTKVKVGNENHYYNYRIVCTLGANVQVIDPMIDVPPR